MFLKNHVVPRSFERWLLGWAGITRLGNSAVALPKKAARPTSSTLTAAVNPSGRSCPSARVTRMPSLKKSQSGIRHNPLLPPFLGKPLQVQGGRVERMLANLQAANALRGIRVRPHRNQGSNARIGGFAESLSGYGQEISRL